MSEAATISTSSTLVSTVMDVSPPASCTISTYSLLSGTIQDSTPKASSTITTSSTVSAVDLVDIGDPNISATVTTSSATAAGIRDGGVDTVEATLNCSSVLSATIADIAYSSAAINGGSVLSGTLGDLTIPLLSSTLEGSSTLICGIRDLGSFNLSISAFGTSTLSGTIIRNPDSVSATINTETSTSGVLKRKITEEVLILYSCVTTSILVRSKIN